MAQHNITGHTGERIAASFLIAKGYSIRHCGWRSGKAELDIVAENETVIVFVEVKTRQTAAYGNPLDAITPSKQTMILNGANDYIEHFEIDKEVRFDVISIVLEGKLPDITHYKEAFGPEF